MKDFSVQRRIKFMHPCTENNFKISKEEMIESLKKSVYKNRFKVYNTFLLQDEDRWRRGKKKEFQDSLANDKLNYFAYVKFYLDKNDKNDKKYAIVAGKSGSTKVNQSGCDLSFSTKQEDGNARKWLQENKKQWCQTEILVIWPEQTDKIDENEKEAFEIERYLQETFCLLGS